MATELRDVEGLRLYTAIADDLARLIESGRLRAGMRAPSVRTLSRQRGVSMTTALAALRTLERRGLVAARPQSGYFVQAAPRRAPEPQPATPPRAAQAVGLGGLLHQLVDAADDPDVVQLGTAVPPATWFPVQPLRRAFGATLARRAHVLAEYGPMAGLVRLRRAIADRYAEVGCALDPDEIVITHGCMEALQVALATVTRPGDVVATESPTYFGFLQLIEHLGLKALEIPTDPRDGLAVDALEAALAAPAGRRVRACVLSASYTNPLGATLPDASRARLVSLCERHDVALVEDDVYGELGFDGVRPRPLKSFDRRGNVILCGSYSKTLSPGLRVGWVANPRRAPELALRRHVSSIGTSAATQHAVADYLATRSFVRHLQRLRLRCRDAVEQMSDAVERSFPAGTRLSRPRGGFVLWVEMPAGVDSVALFAQARPRGIAFAPGPMFSARGAYRHCLRLNCAQTWSPRLAAAIAGLGRLAHG